MNHLEELYEKFPEIPKTLIIKCDAMREGIKYTPLLSQIGQWAEPSGPVPYEIHMEKTYGVVAEAQEGWIVLPYTFRFRDGTNVMIQINKNSPYEIKYVGDGRYMLYRDQELLKEVYFLPRPEWYTKKTQDGTLMSTILCQMSDSWLACIQSTYCAYFATDDVCAFCPVTATGKELSELGVQRKTAASVESIVEAYMVASEEIKSKQKESLNKKPCGTVGCRCRNLLLTTGGMLDTKREAEYYLRTISAIKKADPEAVIHIESQAFDERDAKRLRDAGLHCIQYNLEVWDKKMFEVVCPGKAKYVGWERWIERLIGATKYYERGHVVSNFVIGCEMIPPYGFKTVDEALESNLRGFEFLMQNGVSPSWSILCPSPASKYREHDLLPPAEYFLRLGLETHKLFMKYDLYRPTRSFFCYRIGCPLLGAEFARLRWESEIGAEEFSPEYETVSVKL